MKTPVLLVALLVLTAPAVADWTVTIQGPVTITGPGSGPIVIPTPPVVTPPVPPPVIVPPVPPPVPPVVDNTPFPFPTNCPTGQDDAERYYAVVQTPAGTLYAGRDTFRSPFPYGGYVCVGRLAAGTKNASGTVDVGNMLLWAPVGTPYGLLRCVLVNGRHCP